MLIKKKIAALVLNSVSHDARVLREANSLQSAGYEVTIYGLKLKEAQVSEEKLSSGVRIKRVDYYEKKRQLGLTISSFFGIGFGLIFLITKGLFLLNAMVSLLISFSIILVVSLLMAFRIAHQVFPFLGNEALKSLGFSHCIDYLKITLIERVYRQTFVKSVLADSPDYVHAHDLSTLPMAVQLKAKLPLKIVYDSHEIFEEMADKSENQKVFYQSMQSALSGEVDMFITINESIGKFLGSRYPNLPEPVIVKNASFYSAKVLAHSYDGRLHKASGVDREKKIVLYQGGFGLGRGLEGLIRSAQFFPDIWVLVVMGWGPLEGHLKSLSRDSNCGPKKVAVIPGVSQHDLPFWTQGASVGVIPYVNNCLNHYYCTPNKLWEYPRSGVPIIASAFPELKRPIEEAAMGWVIEDFEKSDQLSELLSTIDSQDLQTAQLNAIRFIEKDNWQKYEKNLLQAYSQLD